MKLFCRITSMFLMICLLLTALPVSADTAVFVAAETQPITGMMVRSRGNADFPSAPNQSAKSMREQIDQIVTYAVEAGYNSIFFEVRPEGDALYSSKVFPTSRYQVRKQGDFTFFDPLREMIKAASKQSLDVWAVIDPYYLGTDAEALDSSHPAAEDPALLSGIGSSLKLNPFDDETVRLNADDIGALVQKYDVAGVLLRGIDYTDGIAQAAVSLCENVSYAIGEKASFGVMLQDEGAFTMEDASGVIEFCDLVIPVISRFPGFNGAGYGERLEAWQALSKPVIPLIDAVSVDSFTGELCDRIFEGSRHDIDSYLVDGYHALRWGKYEQGDLIASLKNVSGTVFSPLNYRSAPALAISRPSAALTTTYSAYFIMGSSDPAQPLTMNGSDIDRRTDDGAFGVFVQLEMGSNTFTFRQGGISETVTITRTDGSITPAVTSKITSMYPVSSAISQSGETISISCVAPSGSRVTATVNGVTVSLTQNAATAMASIPASFSGSVTLTGGRPGSVQSVGPITYTLDHNGAVSSYTSSGNVYLCGEGAEPWIRVTEHAASVFYDEKVEEGNYKAVYKAGTTERIVGQMGEYYRLASTGYIKKAAVEVLQSDAPASVSIERITAQHDGRAERFILEGAAGLPYCFVDNDDGSISLTLYGDLALPEQLNTESTLFSSIQWAQNDDGSIRCTLVPVDADKIWGVDILPGENETILYAKRAPVLSDTVGKPLEGVVVVLDPGHGGTDPGALGVLGVDGPTEKELNLANAQMLKLRLEQLGASVTLTRQTNDETRSLYERMEVAQQLLPDFFLAMHHNSIVEYADGYLHGGVEAYFYEPFGTDFAANAVSRIAAGNHDRKERKSEWGYYTVTRMRYAPSVLVEIAFMPNPVEYRYACDTAEIHKTANALAAAFLQTIRAAE